MQFRLIGRLVAFSRKGARPRPLHLGFPATEQTRVHPEILGRLAHRIALLGDEGDGVPFKVGRILFSSMSSHDTPPLAIIARFEVSISTRPLHLPVPLPKECPR